MYSVLRNGNIELDGVEYELATELSIELTPTRSTPSLNTAVRVHFCFKPKQISLRCIPFQLC